MRILIIEDDNLKFDLIYEFLRVLLPNSLLTRAASYQSGIEQLLSRDFDLVFLDVTLPISDLEDSPVGMKFLTFGGEAILREIRRKGVPVKVLVITQYGSFVRRRNELVFDELKNELMLEYGDIVLGVIRLGRTEQTWKIEIEDILNDENFDR